MCNKFVIHLKRPKLEICDALPFETILVTYVCHYIHVLTQSGPLVKCSGNRMQLPTDVWVRSPGLCAKLNKSLGKVNGLLVVHCRGRSMQDRGTAGGTTLTPATSNITINKYQVYLQGLKITAAVAYVH